MISIKMNRKTLIQGIGIAAALAATPVHADQLAFGLGGGVHRTHGDFGTLFYHKDVSPLFNLDSRVEFSLASWNGDHSNDALGVARSLRWSWDGKTYLSGSLGLAYVSKTNGHLGGHGQFTLRFALGHRFDKYDLSLATHHYSNGGTSSPNQGENFLVLGLGREF